MKSLQSQMSIDTGQNLRDKYRQEKRDSDEFSLVDIDDVIQEAAQTAQDSVESQENQSRNVKNPNQEFFDVDIIGSRKKRSSTDPGAFKQS